MPFHTVRWGKQDTYVYLFPCHTVLPCFDDFLDVLLTPDLADWDRFSVGL